MEIILCILLLVQPANSFNMCTKDVCKLPYCFCPSVRGPDEVSLEDTPKMVLFTFDDAVNEQNILFFKKLFSEGRKNPNGCRITATFFVSDEWTDYDMVRDLYLDGHEIASHTVTHRLPREWWREANRSDWKYELAGQRKNIAKKAKIHPNLIRGSRVPFIELGGDKQFHTLQNEQFEYDATCTSGPDSVRDMVRKPSWPYTLDFPPNTDFCANDNIPKGRFPGIWEIPMNRWIGLDGKACPMVDACTTQHLPDKISALRYLLSNYQRHFRQNRTPLGVNMHATWFKTTIHFEAMMDFIDIIMQHQDVWIITGHQLIQWMRNPTPLRLLKHFKHWKTSCHRVPERELLQRKEPNSRAAWSRFPALAELETKSGRYFLVNSPLISHIQTFLLVLSILLMICCLLRLYRVFGKILFGGRYRKRDKKYFMA